MMWTVEGRQLHSKAPNLVETIGYVVAVLVALAVPFVAQSQLSMDAIWGLIVAAWVPTLVVFLATSFHKKSGSSPVLDANDLTERFGIFSGGVTLAVLRFVLFAEFLVMAFVFGANSYQPYFAAAGFVATVALSIRKAWTDDMSQ